MHIQKSYMLLIMLALINACSKGEAVTRGSSPDCIRKKIEELQKQAVSNPPAMVKQYQYNGQVVYYIPPSAGDQMGQLYGDDCTLICRPDGGITGQGDGRCPDFFDERTEEKIIWQDNRK